MVDLDPAGSVARRWLRGVLHGSRALGWETAFATHRGAGPGLRELVEDRVDGAIGDSAASELVAFARRRRIPCVAFRVPAAASASWRGLLPATGDDAQIGVLAAGHFRGRGFRHAAFVGEETAAPWSRARGASFRRAWLAERASTNRFVGRDGLVVRVRERIGETGGLRLSVAVLAKENSVSERTLELRFRAETGGTVADALLDARLARAQDMLRSTPFTQERIAAECGFCDASHLSRSFRRRLGALPSAFRTR